MIWKVAWPEASVVTEAWPTRSGPWAVGGANGCQITGGSGRYAHARGSGEQRLDLGPIPSGFHVYRIDRQTSTPGSDTVSYYIDGALVAQHTVGTLAPMYVYVSHNGGTAQSLDVERIWAYPAYRDAGSFQSCTMDGGSTPFTWTTATWSS